MASLTRDVVDALDALSPNLNEDRSLLLALVLLALFTLSFLGLAVWFKVLWEYKWKMDPPPNRAADGGGFLAGLETKLKVLVSGWSDLELQRLLQSSSAEAGLIFTVVGFLAPFVTSNDLARVLVGLVALGNQVVLFTWIYVESWGAFLNSFILTGTLTTAAFAARGIAIRTGTNTTAAFPTRGIVPCEGYGCFFRDTWERRLMDAMFFFILLTALLNVILAAGPLLGFFSNSYEKISRRVSRALDAHLGFMVDWPVESSSDKKNKHVSETLVGEIVELCMGKAYLREMQEKVYGGLRSTDLRVVVAAVPTVVLSAVGMWLRADWRWGGAAAAALLAASWSAIFFGFLCARQRENRLPLCFSRGNDIHESFENATADLFGMNRGVFEEATQKMWDHRPEPGASHKGFIETLRDDKKKKGGCLEINWVTCNFMVIQTLGLTELGHFELQAEEEAFDPNSNSELQGIWGISEDLNGLVKRRGMILEALRKRNPVKIGPTAMSKIAGVMMALKNAIHCMKVKMIHQSQV